MELMRLYANDDDDDDDDELKSNNNNDNNNNNNNAASNSSVKKIFNGTIQETYVNDAIFDIAMKSHKSYGKKDSVVNNFDTGNDGGNGENNNLKRKRKANPWAADYDDYFTKQLSSSTGANADKQEEEEKVEKKEIIEREEEEEKDAGERKNNNNNNNNNNNDERKDKKEKNEKNDISKYGNNPTSIFHGDSLKDYQGRSYLAPPPTARPSINNCYIPKKVLRSITAHTKGVSAIRYFPVFGHVLLSCGMDCKIKLWDVSSFKCVRSYLGHTKAIRDINFNNDGSKFLSCGYDKKTRLWDTETGTCISTFTYDKMVPYCGKFNPDVDKQNALLIGGSINELIQWDSRSGEIEQKYDHLSSVNTVTFIDDNRRICTTSDDRILRFFDYGVPVPIRSIASPSMHAIPAVITSSNSEYIICQNLDNAITLYSGRNKIGVLVSNKQFTGHNIAGYGCQMCLSPDEKWLASGDSSGNVFYWDFKTSKLVQKLESHPGHVVISTQWHPYETSRVATAGWDGLIKFWD